MSADIWFPFYSLEYLGDTRVRGLPRIQRAILVELWCFHWRDDGLDNDLAKLCRLLGDVAPDDVQAVVAAFFVASDDGKTLYSPRMRREKLKANTIHAARVKGGKYRAAQQAAQLKMSSQLRGTQVQSQSQTAVHRTNPEPPAAREVSADPVPGPLGEIIARWESRAGQAES